MYLYFIRYVVIHSCSSIDPIQLGDCLLIVYYVSKEIHGCLSKAYVLLWDISLFHVIKQWNKTVK